jgi:hypothetical protein
VRGRIDYHYDPAGRLLRQHRSLDLPQEQFVWDAAGNLLDNNHGNRLKVWQDLRFEYDPWGNVSHKRKGSRLAQRFTFDAEDRLIAVTCEEAQRIVETRFDYDPIGRRIASSETRRDAYGSSEVQRKRFVWQGLRMVQEIRESGVSSYIYSPDEMYTPLARVDAFIGGAMASAAIDKARATSRVYHFHTDLVGTPLEVTDEAGELAWAGKYTVWGKVERGEDAALMGRIEQPLRSGACRNPHRRARQYPAESARSLHAAAGTPCDPRRAHPCRTGTACAGRPAPDGCQGRRARLCAAEPRSQGKPLAAGDRSAVPLRCRGIRGRCHRRRVIGLLG